MQFSIWKLKSRRWSLVCALAVAIASVSQTATALIVENMAGTTSEPADDPGWNFVTGTGSRAYTYLGNGWAISAFHVGVPLNNEAIIFNGTTYNIIPNQSYIVPNPTGQGLTADTDLRLIRINGDVGTPTFSLASAPIMESTPMGQREVVIIGAGPTREANQAHWNVQVQSGNNNDIWTEVPSGGTYHGYKAIQSGADADVKRWGTNLIADEDALMGISNDADLRGKLTINLQVGPRDVMSMFTQFDQSGLTNEAQAVSGDSGSAVFYKRGSNWELVGIINATYSTYDNQMANSGQGGIGTSAAVYGNYTTFADLSFYHDVIQNIMNGHMDYSVMGDINLDGVVNGSTTGGSPTGDIAAFVAGWGFDNGTGVGTIDSWKKGDLNRDGKVDAADFVLLRNAVNPTGGGGFSLDSLLGVAGVPEPSSVLLGLAGMSLLAGYRRRS